MSTLPLAPVTLAACFALMSLGGGCYEFLVVDPAWPRRPEVIQPTRGGISRKRFWIPAHTAFELSLIVSLIAAWSQRSVRTPLLVGLASHVLIRLWSAVDFIPKALAFERADPAAIGPDATRRWTPPQPGRLPLDLITCGTTLAALVAAARLG